MNHVQIVSLVSDNYPTESAEMQERMIQQYLDAERVIQNKCECGHIWVGPRSYHCISCIIELERKENGHAPYQAH